MNSGDEIAKRFGDYLHMVATGKSEMFSLRRETLIFRHKRFQLTSETYKPQFESIIGFVQALASTNARSTHYQG